MKSMCTDNVTEKGLNNDIWCGTFGAGANQNCSHLPGLKIILHTMLKPFSFGLERCDDQAVTNKMCRVADALAGAKAAKRDIHTVYHELANLTG